MDPIYEQKWHRNKEMQMDHGHRNVFHPANGQHTETPFPPNSVAKERATGSQVSSHTAGEHRRHSPRGGAAWGEADSHGVLLSDPVIPAPGQHLKQHSHTKLCLHTLFTAAHFLFLCLRFNSHTMMLTLLKHTIQWILVYSHSCATITTTQFQDTFIIPRKKLHTYQSFLISSSAHALATTDLSMDLPILDVSYKWDLSICGLFFQLA